MIAKLTKPKAGQCAVGGTPFDWALVTVVLVAIPERGATGEFRRF